MQTFKVLFITINALVKSSETSMLFLVHNMQPCILHGEVRKLITLETWQEQTSGLTSCAVSPYCGLWEASALTNNGMLSF